MFNYIKGEYYMKIKIYEESYRQGHNKMIIEVESGMSSDGFIIRIIDDEGSKIFDHSYYYGDNASYKKSWATRDKPYVSDVIKELRDKYNIDESDVEVISGANVFKGSKVSDDNVKDFISSYLN